MSLMPGNGNDDAADAVDPHVTAQHGGGAERAIAHALQGQRDQRDDDQRVEDDGGQDRARRRGQPHDVQLVEHGIGRGERGRNDGEVLRHVVGDAERGQRAARHQQLLADLDDLDQLGRIGVEIDHVAGFLGGLRAGVHGHRHVGLGQRRRIVGAVAGHRHQPPLGLVVADHLELGLRRGLGQEVVDAGLGGDGGGGERVVAGDHHRLDAHLPQLAEPLLDPALDDVLQLDDAEHSAPSATTSGVPPALAMVSTATRTSGGTAPPICRTWASMARRRPCGSGGRPDRRRSSGSGP